MCNKSVQLKILDKQIIGPKNKKNNNKIAWFGFW